MTSDSVLPRQHRRKSERSIPQWNKRTVERYIRMLKVGNTNPREYSGGSGILILTPKMGTRRFRIERYWRKPERRYLLKSS